MSELSTIRFCRQLRKEMSKAEAMLWMRLRRNAIAGHKFRRQHPVGPYILDFACCAKRLAIEVDGQTHLSDEVRVYDWRRRADLSSLGWREIRVTNEDVLFNLDRVVEHIGCELVER